MISAIALAAALAGGLSGCGGQTSADSKDGPAEYLPKAAPPEQVTVPAGTRLRVALIDGISTQKNAPGDQFMASLAEPVVVEGKMVLDKGTNVRGRVLEVRESGRVKGRASLNLALTEIIHDGKKTPIQTRPFIAVAESTKKRDAAVIGGGAGAGAAIGAITGGGKGAGIGALIGGGAGTGVVLGTKGKELNYAPEARLNFTLAEEVKM
jgi:hypothetical protein